MISDDFDDTPQAARIPAIVWHYTGFNGLQGMLNGKIWASSAAYLNDTEEFRHTIGIALQILEQNRESKLVEFRGGLVL